MRRNLLLGLGGCAALALITLAWNSQANQNGPPNLAQAGGKGNEPEHALPIRQVVLFNSGVGYFQREGEVQGESRVDFSFPTSDINDLLKSLVLQDLGGGKVATVSYDSQDPIEKILRSFAIDLNNNPTFGQILNQARGEKVELTLAGKEKAERITGTIVGMEVKQVCEKDCSRSADILNFLGSNGLQAISLEKVLGVRFLNQALDNEFQRALKVLAASHDVQKKTVTVGFNGQGRRAVRVGYVVERPIWKTTYRLRMEPGGKVFLQGWALVENTSDDDWNDVRMVLVSGRPISFRMNLYEPLYIPRPLVEPDQFASLRPPVYTGGLTNSEQPIAGAPGQPATQGAFNPMHQVPGNFGNMGGGQLNPLGNLGGNALNWGAVGNTNNPYQNKFRSQITYDQNRLTYEELQNRRLQAQENKKVAKEKGAAIAMNFKEGIQSIASAEEVGDYFQYLIDQRISLSRQKSAMLPILDQGIEGAKVSIFNESVHPKHPLLGLRLKNTSGQPLTQGPITVYDNTTYAGDTRILDLQPNEERLLSYALDQGTEIKTDVKGSPSPEMTFRVDDANMTARYLYRETKKHLIKNRSTHDRVVVLEHPIRSGWKLVNPVKPHETTRNVYRFQVAVEAGKAVTFDVVEEQPRVDQVALRGGQPSYVATTGIQVKSMTGVQPTQLMGVRVMKGVVTPTLKSREVKTLVVQNMSDVDREFAIDHVVRDGWTLLLEKNGKLAGPSVHRFTLKVAKDKSGHIDFTEEKIFQEKERPLKDVPDAAVRVYLASEKVSDKVKDGLRKHLELSQRIADTSRELTDVEKQLRNLSEDQARLRENLKIIPQTSEPYKKFLEKFVAQESEIEALQRQVRQVQASLTAVQREHGVLLASWTAE